MKAIVTRSKTLNESDFDALKMMIERTGADEILEALNEWKYNDTVFTSRRTGGAELKRWDGVLKTLPGLVLTTLICWPVAAFMGVGIIGSRIKQTWEDKKHWWQKLLDPGYWGEYYKLRNEDKDGGPLWSHPVIINKKGEKREVLLKDGKIVDKETGEVYNYNDVEQPENCSKTALHDYWLTLSNNEIIRISADTEEHAKNTANFIINNIKNIYTGFNQKLSQGGTFFELYFSDGEYLYWVAKDKETAKIEALHNMQQLNSEYLKYNDQYYKNINVVNIKSKSSVKKIEAPKENVFLNITTSEPKFNKSNEAKAALNELIYKFGNFDAYRVSIGGSTLHVPGKFPENVAEMIKQLVVNGECYKKMCKGYNNSNCKMYKIPIADGDKYIVFADGANEAMNLASAFHSEKIKFILKSMDNKDANDFKDRMDEYKENFTTFSKNNLPMPQNTAGRTFVFPHSFTVSQLKKLNKVEDKGTFNL